MLSLFGLSLVRSASAPVSVGVYMKIMMIAATMQFPCPQGLPGAFDDGYGQLACGFPLRLHVSLS